MMRKEDVERSISRLDEQLRDALLLSTKHTYTEGAKRLKITRKQLVQRVDDAKRRVITDLLGDWQDSESMFLVDMYIDAVAMEMQRRRMGVLYRMRKWLQSVGQTATGLVEAVGELLQGRQVSTPIGAVATIAVVVVAVYIVERNRSREPTGEVRPPIESVTHAEEPPPEPEPEEPPPEPEPEEPPPEPEPAPAPEPEPGSDGVVRRLAGELSEHPMLAAWLDTDELALKFVDIVIHIAEETNPFQVEGEPSSPLISASFDRYDDAAELVASLDTEKTARLFEHLRPLLEDAYKELGQPGSEFQDTLWRAAVHLLNAPPIIIREWSSLFAGHNRRQYLYPDEASPAQRQLIGMGPDNQRRVQRKIRQIAEAIGLTDLPDLPLPRGVR